MSIRRLVICLSLALVVVVLIGIPFRSQLASQGNTQTPTVIAGRNVNMVSGTTLPGGDPWLQRQNEPSIAVSSRNPLHLLAGANDYRTVDMPISEGELPGKGPVAMVGDAWLGVFMSYDGGESWTSTMLPGYPQDPNGNPLKNYRTAADPVVRCGPNGLFYYSGIAFNRDTNLGVVFVARFIDNNNIEGGSSKERGGSIQYIDTKIIATGAANKFLDKPWIAVDQPRVPMTNITVAGQSIPRHNVYIAYSAFATSGSTTGDIMFARSADCGTTWGAPIKISSGNFAHQGAVIAIKPVLGEVLVAFRRFAQTKTTPDSIYVAQSLTRGLSFASPVKVADIAPFDQPTTSPTQSLPGTLPGPAFRTNSYPTIAVDASGHVYLAWSQRGVGPNGDARIMVSSSYMGSSWSSPQPAASMNENASFLGHQIMPSFSFAAGKLILVWYDERHDVSATQYGFNNWIQDALTYNTVPLRHTMDVWAAVADTSKFPTLTWKSTQVSRYLFAALKDDHGDLVRDANNNPIIFPAQFNCVNDPLFKGGLNPFMGDYIDVAASPTFRIDTWRNWYFNATSTDSPVFHVAWADNRDVRPPLNGDWTAYTPASSDQLSKFISTDHPSCSGGNAPGMRNQNIYTSRVTWGIEAGSPTNAKSLNLSGAARAFVVYVKNNTGSSRHYRLTIATQPVGGQASFDQFDLLTTLDVDIAAYSTISRTVFISSTDQTAPVTINIDEIDALGSVITGGLESSILLNADPANPQVPAIDETHNPNIINSANPNIINWYVNPNIINPNIINPNIINPNIINPNIINPNIINYDLSNPNIINPNIINPNIINPNIINVSNPNIINPNIINPNIINPNIINSTPENNSITDVAWTVTNTGTATTAYSLKTLSKKEPPDGVYVQLLVYRVHYTPAVAGAELSASGISGCELKQEPHHELVLSIVNPNIINPNIINPNIINPNIINSSIENATFSVAPGEEVTVDLRVLDTGLAQTSSQSQAMMKAMASGSSAKASTVKDFLDSLGFAVTSQAVNTVDARQGIQIPPAAATELVIGTSSLPDGVFNTPYNATLNAYGGSGGYSWSLNSGELPPPLTISSSGIISGVPTKPGPYQFIVRVDAGNQFDTQQYSIFIDNDSVINPLAIVTTSLPGGVQGYWYGATLQATGGVWPRTWSLAGGSLPPGLSIDSGGTIGGTPTSSGTFSFSVRVRDANGASKTQPLSLTISGSTTTHIKISGTVYDENGYPLNGAVLRGLPNTPVSGANGTPGYYEDVVPAGWSGTTEAFKVGYNFVPANYTYSHLSGDKPGQDFNGTLAATEQWAQTNHTGQSQILRDMAVDTAGSIYLTGANGGQIYTVKYGRGGTRLWEAPLIGTPGNNSHGDAIFVSPRGDVFVTGKIDDADIFTVKYDGATGAILWSGQYDGGYPADEGADIAVDAMGDIYVTGWIWNGIQGVGNPDYCTIKYRYDPGAHTYQSAWTRIFNGGGHDVASKIGIDAAGNIIVGGYSFGGSTLDDTYLIKYDSAGNELWHSRYDGGTTNDYINDLRLDSAGNIYVTGFKRAAPPNETNTADYLTVKFNSSGTVQWAASYDGNGNQFDDIANALTVGPGGSVYVTGRSGARTDGTNVYDDYATIKYDSAGHAVWTPGGGIDSRGAARYDGPPGTDQDVAYSIGVDIQGSVYVTGASVGLDGSFDFATLKYSSSGARLWAQRYGENNHMDDQAKALALDPLGNIIVAGTSGSDLLILKYGQDFSAHLVITTDILPAGVAGAGYSAMLQAFGGTGSRAWSVGGLPAGLNFDGSSGLITGAPSTPGIYNLTVTVTDGSLNDTKPVSLTIAGGGAPFQLAFTQGPSNTAAGAVITPPVTVAIQDQWGNLATTATNIVVLSLRNAGSATLGGITSKAAVGGVATFDNLTVNLGGSGYLLRANSGSLKEVDSSSFNVTALVLDHFDITPSSISTQIIGTPFQITVTAKDVNGNVVTNYSGTNTLSLNFYPYTNITPTNVALANGVWQGNVTITAAEYGVVISTSGGSKSGQCNAFDVLYPGPYSTISGQISYNGAPFTTGAHVDFALFDYGGGHRYPIPPSSFNPTNGTYSIPNVRSGTYAIDLRTDNDTPPNYLPYPGDYQGSSAQFIVSAPTPVTQDAAVRRIIHLTAPVDNNPPPAPGIPIPPPYAAYQSPIPFQWDAIPGAATYQIIVFLVQNSPWQILNDHFYQESGILGTQKSLSLPVSDPNQHYEFEVIAYNGLSAAVGELSIVFTIPGGGIYGHGGFYPFQVAAPVQNQIQVETAADGSGTVVPAQNLRSGFPLTVYAVSRGAGGNFIGNVAADSWSLINKTGGVVDGDLVLSGDMKSATFTGNALGSAIIHAAKSGSTSVDSGVLTVIKAEEWVVRYSATSGAWNDEAIAMAVDSSGNTFVTGFVLPNGIDFDYATVKYNSAGTQQWLATYNNTSGANPSDYGQAVATDSWGNVYVTGYTPGIAIATIKYNSSGARQWLSPYNGYAVGASAIAVDSSGNVYVTGEIKIASDSSSYATVKYDTNGNQIWAVTYGGKGGISHPCALAVDSSGNVYVTGTITGSNTGNPDYATVKYDANGNQLWAAKYDDSNGDIDIAYALAVDSSGNVYITGESFSDFGTIKYDTNGNQVWVRTYNGPGAGNGYDSGRAIAVDSSGNVYVAGTSNGGSSDADYATIKYDSDGNQVWVARYNGPGNGSDTGSAIHVDPLGNVYVSGTSVGNGSGQDYATIKYNNLGITQWVFRYNGPGNGDDDALVNGIDSLGNVYVTGFSTGSGTGHDYATLKYLQSFASTLIISTEAMDIGLVGIPYAKALWAFGGSGLRTWSKIAGTLPPGINLDSGTGILSGTPTTQGTYNFTVQVVDGSLTATKALSITVHNPMISGQIHRITDSPSGPVYDPIPNVIIYFSGGAGTATTDASGNYSKTVSLGWTGTVVPAITSGHDYNCRPAFKTYAGVTDSVPDQHYEALFHCNIFFNNQPGNTGVGQVISPPLEVTVIDDFGLPMPGFSVTIALGGNPGSGTLSGAGTYITNSAGKITLSTLSINAIGRGYTILATWIDRTVSTLPFDIH